MTTVSLSAMTTFTNCFVVKASLKKVRHYLELVVLKLASTRASDIDYIMIRV
jgi:hypothetical protein